MRYLTLLLMLAGVACTPVNSGQRQAPPPAGDTLQQLRALVGPATCSTSADCRSLPLGANACGGPQSYLAWSAVHTKPERLLALAERFKAERKAEIEATGEMSTCQMKPDPGAVCQANICQLRSAPAGAF